MVKSVLYEGTIALGTDVDFWKGLGRSEPWGNYCGSGWRTMNYACKHIYFENWNIHFAFMG